MDICYLSVEEVQRKKLYGIPINHEQHKHVSYKEAVELMKMDVVAEVTGIPLAIMDQESNNRIWRLTKSGGVKVQQLVRTGNAY